MRNFLWREFSFSYTRMWRGGDAAKMLAEKTSR